MSKKRYFTPGKLFLAGEYFVVNGDSDAILIPTKKGIKIEIQSSSDEYYHLHTKDKTYSWMKGKHKNLHINAYVDRAIDLVFSFLHEQNIKTWPMTIKIRSSLESVQGQSYGFGSSGAVVIGLLKSITRYVHLKLSNLEVYKLAVLAMNEERNHASFADLALSAFEEPILYHVFDKEWFSKLDKKDYYGSMKKPWKDLKIEPVKLKWGNSIVVNSGVKSQSILMVKRFQTLVDEKTYQQYLEEFLPLMDKVKVDKNVTILEEIQTLYKNLSQKSFGDYWIKEYDEILQLCSDSCSFAKVSGAGGGDNLILFFEVAKHMNICSSKLKDQGFTVFENNL